MLSETTSNVKISYQKTHFKKDKSRLTEKHNHDLLQSLSVTRADSGEGQLFNLPEHCSTQDTAEEKTSYKKNDSSH